jgi:hypothetical protein
MDKDHTTSSQTHTFTSRVLFGEKRIPNMASWLVKRSVIRNLPQARKVIIGLIIFDFVAAGVVTYFFIIR